MPYVSISPQQTLAEGCFACSWAYITMLWGDPHRARCLVDVFACCFNHGVEGHMLIRGEVAERKRLTMPQDGRAFHPSRTERAWPYSKIPIGSVAAFLGLISSREQGAFERSVRDGEADRFELLLEEGA